MPGCQGLKIILASYFSPAVLSSSNFWLLPDYSLQCYQNQLCFPLLTWSWWGNIWTNCAANTAILCQRSRVDVLLLQVLNRPKLCKEAFFEMRACFSSTENINFLLHSLTFNLLRVEPHTWAFICFIYLSYFFLFFFLNGPTQQHFDLPVLRFLKY